MWNFLPREQTIGLTFACLVLYAVIYFLLRPAKHYPYKLKKGSYIFAIVLLLVLSLFFFTVSDWFGYYKEYLEANRGLNTHLESIYEWLAINFAPNYFVWRLLVWGIALLLLLMTIKRLPVPSALCLLVFVVMAFSRFAYTRTALAYSIMFFVCSLLYDPERKASVFRKIICFTLIASSYFFHKSALFGIGMIVISYIMKRMDGKTILLLVVFLPLLLIVLRNQISDFMMMEFESGESVFSDYMNVGQKYMERNSRTVRGISRIIHDFLLRGPVIIMGVVCFLSSNDMAIPQVIRFFMRMTVFMVIASLICRLDLGANTFVMYYRFLNYAVIPAVFSFSYLYSNRCYPKLLNFIYIVAALGTFYEMAYSVYDRYINGPINFGF